MSELTRRGLFAAGAAAGAVGLAPGVARADDERRPTPEAVRFTLDATVLDGGEQVTSVSLETRRFGRISPASLTKATFTVHVKATNPVTGLVAYDLDRVVTSAHIVDEKIVLGLRTRDLQPGGSTLEYVGSAGRNVLLDLEYTITQTAPLRLHNGRSLTLPAFRQGRLVDPEVDAYSYRTSGTGMNYRLFTPRIGEGRRPLVLWLHGGGEGGLLSADYYDNEPVLRANRGALGFSTPLAQKAFGGAYVVAPQAETFWLENAVAGGPNYSGRLKKLVDELVRKHDIDPTRIYVAGCSNGGYMSLELTNVYHGFFAASVPICGVVAEFRGSGGPIITDPELAAIDTPTWLVTSADDDTVDPVANSVHASRLIPGAVLSEYDTVTWGGLRYPGHWSWIYVARNDPKRGGQHVWQWMAAQQLG